MSAYDFDLFTIGAGSGGVRASRMAANYGARVAIAEERYLGGTCVNVGCVPKKLLFTAAHFAQGFRDARGFGWIEQSPRFDWRQLIANKDREIERLNGIYRRLLKDAGVQLLEGHARLLDPHTVQVGERRFTAHNVLLATGSWPTVPQLPGAAEYGLTSNEAFYLTELPQRVVVVGGGYIGVEFAGIFNGLGVETTLVHRGELFLRGFDREIRETLAKEMRNKGINLRFSTQIRRVEKTGEMLSAQLSDETTVACGAIMFATGRHPLTANLGLEQAGVKLTETGAVAIDDRFQTSCANIYAIGDVTDRVTLTPVAIAEGAMLASNLFNGGDARFDYEAIPTAVFSQPTIGTVGLTEEQARKRHADVAVYRSSFRPLQYTLTDNPERCLVKLIVDRQSDRVLGCHMTGPEAPEIVQSLAVALKCGATKADFDRTVAVHPTLAEEFVTLRKAS